MLCGKQSLKRVLLQSGTERLEYAKRATGEKRPRDVIGAAVKVAKIATGEIEEDTDPKVATRAAAAELGKRGGKAREDALSPERRKEIARKAAIKRWQKQRDQST
jgi:hypothetical protein